jgi:hypothetical protein
MTGSQRKAKGILMLTDGVKYRGDQVPVSSYAECLQRHADYASAGVGSVQIVRRRKEEAVMVAPSHVASVTTQLIYTRA